MPAKGGSKDCCCGGCADPPRDPGLIQNAVQPLQQYCCNCIPKELCVGFSCYDEENPFITGNVTTWPRRMRCAPGYEDEPTEPYYSGRIYFNGGSADGELFFKVVDGVCYLCLVSEDLGLYRTGGTTTTDYMGSVDGTVTEVGTGPGPFETRYSGTGSGSVSGGASGPISATIDISTEVFLGATITYLINITGSLNLTISGQWNGTTSDFFNGPVTDTDPTITADSVECTLTNQSGSATFDFSGSPPHPWSVEFTVTIECDRPTACIEITEYDRDILCPQCEQCPDIIDDLFVVMPLDVWPCFGHLRIRPANNVSFRRLPPCDGCPRTYDSCQNCREHCGGCGCICKCACITISRGGLLHTETVCIDDDFKYTTVGDGENFAGWVIGVNPNYENGCCELWLEATGDAIIANPDNNFPLEVPIGRADLLNPCPRPHGEWRFFEYGAEPGRDIVRVLFDCTDCGSGCFVNAGGCCDEQIPKLPRVVNADCSGCCDDFSFPLIYDTIDGVWQGTSGPTDMCDHALTLRLSCNGSPDVTGWRLTLVGAGQSGPCIDVSVDSDVTSACDPLNLVFSVPANGIGCCGLMGGTLSVNIVA